MKPILIAALITAAFASPSTYAAAYSSVSIGNYQLSLVDLNPNDGIDPTISFAQQNYASINFVGYVAGTPVEDNVYKQFELSGTGVVPISVSKTYTTNTTSAAIAGETFMERSAEASSSSLGNSERGAASTVYNTFGFTLSPFTQLTVTATTAQYAEIVQDPNNNNQRGYADAHLRIISDDFLTYAWNFEQTYTDEFASGGDGSVSYNTLAVLSVMYQNNSNDSFNALISSSIYANATSSHIEGPSAVPVPAALPLMASAFGLFSIARRRNKNKSV